MGQVMAGRHVDGAWKALERKRHKPTSPGLGPQDSERSASVGDGTETWHPIALDGPVAASESPGSSCMEEEKGIEEQRMRSKERKRVRRLKKIKHCSAYSSEEKEYLPDENATKAQVYRCRRCGVRIVCERDVVKCKGGRKGTYVFEKIRNIEDGRCSRCSLEIGGSGIDGELDLFLEDGSRAFVKSAFRILVAFYAHEFEEVKWIGGRREGPEDVELYNPAHKDFFINMKRRYFEKEFRGLDIEVETVVLSSYVVFGKEPKQPSSYRVPYNIVEKVLAREYGEDFVQSFLPVDGDLTTKVKKNADLALIIQGPSSSEFILWSGRWATQMEKHIAGAWQVSGGNVLLLNWGLPDEAEKFQGMKSLANELRGKTTRWNGGFGPGKRLLRERDGEDYGCLESNNQYAFADLIERGHYGGFWSQRKEIPAEIKKKISCALKKGIYDWKWQTMNKLPPAFFDENFGDKVAKASKMEPLAPCEKMARPVFLYKDVAFD